MIPTILIGGALAVLFGLALRRLVKHGACDCSGKGGCGGNCGNCPYCSQSAGKKNHPE